MHQGTSWSPRYKLQGLQSSSPNLLVEWETGETPYESHLLLAREDPVTCAEYGKDHNLLDQHNSMFVKTSNYLIRAIKRS